jgi:hypothetical protein
VVAPHPMHCSADDRSKNVVGVRTDSSEIECFLLTQKK